MGNAKLSRNLTDHPALRADQQHAGVRGGSVTHATNITTSDALSSTDINHPHAEVDNNEEVDPGTVIRLARTKAKLTQAQLAKKLGVRQSAVSQWENGTVSPEMPTRLRLAQLLHIPPSQLFPEYVDLTNIPEEAMNNPRALRLLARIVRLPSRWQDFVELFLEDLEDKIR